jgi:hypothetical protein
VDFIFRPTAFIVISDSETASHLQTYKGSGFVLITAVMLYVLLRKASSSQTTSEPLPVEDKFFGRINTSIVRKGLALISIPLLFLVAFAWFALRLQQRYAAAAELELHSKQVIAQTYRMVRSIDETAKPHSMTRANGFSKSLSKTLTAWAS